MHNIKVTRSTNINKTTPCVAQFLFASFPKLVRLFRTSATVTLCKLTQVFTILMFILQVVGWLSYALNMWVFGWWSEKMGEAAKRQVPMEKAGIPRGPTQPYTTFRPHYLIRRHGCLWPD